jgi:acetyl/propionyl-CoA carboxylase alpha subunit
MLQVKVNKESFEISNQKLNGELLDWDLLDFKDGTFHILSNSKSYRAKLIKLEEGAKSMIIEINGNEYTVALKDKYDILLEKLGMNAMATAKVNNLKAPMPGLVFDIKIKEGDTLQKGDVVLVLEAMKMENMLKAPADAVVKKVMVKKGDAVEKNQVLVEFE